MKFTIPRMNVYTLEHADNEDKSYYNVTISIRGRNQVTTIKFVDPTRDIIARVALFQTRNYRFATILHVRKHVFFIVRVDRGDGDGFGSRP